ncbi:MAG: pectinesterase, partial [Bacteroidetes bacterium]|nr:pectinesterase [Bacteroidota bacterium]
MAHCWNVSGLLFLLLAGPARGGTGENADVVVCSRGSGHTRSIQRALDSLEALPPGPVLVLIRNGLYVEQVFIRRSNLTIVGENRDSTRIVFPVLREEWNRTHGG